MNFERKRKKKYSAKKSGSTVEKRGKKGDACNVVKASLQSSAVQYRRSICIEQFRLHARKDACLLQRFIIKIDTTRGRDDRSRNI